MRALRADGSGDTGAEMTGRANVARKLRVDFTKLGNFVHRSIVDFFLGVEASAHGPFVKEMKERAGLNKANGFGVGKNVKSDLRGNAAVEQFILGGPGIMHSAIVDFLRARIAGKKHGRDVIRISRIGQA